MVSNVNTLVGGMEANGVGFVQSPIARVPLDYFNFCIIRSNVPHWWHAPTEGVSSLPVPNNKRQTGHIIEWHKANPQVIKLGLFITDSHLDLARAIVHIHLPTFLIGQEVQTKSRICCCNNLLESPPAMRGRFHITTLRPVVQVKIRLQFLLPYICLRGSSSFRSRTQHICSAPFKGISSRGYEMIGRWRPLSIKYYHVRLVSGVHIK